MTRWIDTLPDVSESPQEMLPTDGVLALAMALGQPQDSPNWQRYAAAHIVAWRKSLGVESDRVNIYIPRGASTSALWMAVQSVAAAARYTDPHRADDAARMLRYAEAVLREQWKRRQS